jgi:hypothetical protein
MTDRQTPLRQDGHDADDNWPDGWAGSLDDWDDSLDGWDGRAAPAHSAAPPRVGRPWFGDQRWLFGLIGAAAAALVVAAVLLITGRDSGQIPTAPDLSTRAPTNTTTALTPRVGPPSSPTSVSATSVSAASSTSELPSPVETPDPIQSATSATELPPEPSSANRTKNQDAPQINVTRTPMSFSPGKR